MAPDDHVNQGGNQPQPQSENGSPAPFLDDPRATIYLDGLIYAAFNKDRKVLESAILTQAKGHQLDVEVRLRGSEQLLFPTPEHPWNPDHGAINAAGPFWLYVDSGNGIKAEEFSAEVHGGKTDRSFDSVFNFEGHHGKPLPLNPENFAVFNFPHGTSYSARTNEAELKIIPPNKPVANAVSKGKIPVSNLAGIDIDAVSNGAGKKSIVLANQDGRNEFFRFELEPGKQYEIKILNQPAPNSAPAGPEGHFLQFYELFDVDLETLQRFLVVNPEHAHNPESQPEGGELGGLGAPSPDNPPCAPGRSGGTGGLSGGG